jgi:hypothetical protein
MPTPKKYRAVKKAAKAQGRATKKVAKQTGTSIKRGTKTAAKGERQYHKSRAAESKSVSKGKTVTTRQRNKTNDARIKIKSGRAVAESPAPGKKPQKKVYRTAENANYQGGRTGQKKYITARGKQTNRKGGRA